MINHESPWKRGQHSTPRGSRPAGRGPWWCTQRVSRTCACYARADHGVRRQRQPISAARRPADGYHLPVQFHGVRPPSCITTRLPTFASSFRDRRSTYDGTTDFEYSALHGRSLRLSVLRPLKVVAWTLSVRNAWPWVVWRKKFIISPRGYSIQIWHWQWRPQVSASGRRWVSSGFVWIFSRLGQKCSDVPTLFYLLNRWRSDALC